MQEDRDQIRQMVRSALEQQIGGQASSDAALEALDESTKDVITESDLRGVSAGARVIVREDAIITPAARDLISERKIALDYRRRRGADNRTRLIAIGADHGGFEMKERLKLMLEEFGCRYRDFGTYSEDAVDYPDFAHAVARAVADGNCDLGVIVDGAGIGSCMAANKVPGVRAAMCYDEATARNSREHNYANVLTLGGRLIPADKIREIVKTWLATPEGEARHGKRVAKITAIEKQYLR